MNFYNDFLGHERSFSDKYLKSVQIFDERFDEDYYSFLLPFFKNSILINKIYSIIDDLLKILDLNYNIRYLILGDFLFSMTSYDLSDPSHLIFKTNRNEYILKIKLRAIINEIYGSDIGKYLLLHKKLLIGLRVSKIIKKTIVRTIGVSWKTAVYFELSIEEISSKHLIPIGSSSAPFILVDIDNTKYSLASFRNIWKTKRKKREMEGFKICYESVIKANQINFFISSKLLKINHVCIENEKNKLLEGVNCISIDDYLKKVIVNIKDNKYINALLIGKEIIEDTTNKDIFMLSMNVKSEYIELMINFQKLFSMFLLNQNLLDKHIYLPCFIDNRGRQYYGTLISPTFYKLFRYLYEFSIEKDFINLDDSEFYKRIIQYKNLVKEFELDSKKTYISIVLFIEIGKLFIKPNKDCFIKTDDIIENGIKNYKDRNINLEFADLLYVQKIYYILHNLLNNNIIIFNTIIFKDATASGLQNYGIIKGYKKDMLKYLNLNGIDWCDTYQYIIEKFLKNKLENKKWADSNLNTNLLKRKYWKSTIMTIPYNAVWFTCFTKFIDRLKEDKIDYNKLENNEKKQLIWIHKEFYKDVKENIKNEFYNNISNNVIIFKYNKWIIVNSKDYKINYMNARDKYSDTLYMINNDKEGTERALEANNMHYRDSELVKEILRNFEVLSIHDCFGIRLSELHLVMDKINEYYSKKIGIQTYSIHVIK